MGKGPTLWTPLYTTACLRLGENMTFFPEIGGPEQRAPLVGCVCLPSSILIGSNLPPRSADGGKW